MMINIKTSHIIPRNNRKLTLFTLRSTRQHKLQNHKNRFTKFKNTRTFQLLHSLHLILLLLHRGIVQSLSKICDDFSNGDHRELWQRSRMSLPVTDQSRFLRKLLSTNITSIRSLTCVYQNMLLLSSSSRELLATNRARKRPDTFVDPQMKVQIPLLTKSLTTSLANHFLLPLVPQQMLLQVLLGRHTTFAQITLVRSLVVLVFHVRLQGRHALASVTANCANNWRCVAMHLLRVLHHVVLDLELFPTDCTRIVKPAGVLSNEMILQRPPVVAFIFTDTARI